MSDPMRQLTAEQAAQRLGVSTRTLSRYVAAGLITPRQRTPRGHRRFLAFDVDRLTRGECTRCGRPLGHPAPCT
jgi:excisionase family DNA binding protein